MLYYEFEAGDKAYKLRLGTKNIIDLEKKIGGNPLSIFGAGDRVPSVTEMVYILQYSLQQYQHNITLEDAYNIFDKYIEAGNTSTDFIKVVVEIYKVSGIIADEKNQ